MPEINSPSLGRISGPLLKENLIRDGVNLTFRNKAFDRDLLFLDVINNRIGINNEISVYDLDINETTNIRDSVVVSGSSAIFENLVLSPNSTISSTIGPIVIQPVGPDAYIYYDTVLTTDFKISDNYIESVVTNSNIVLDPAGTGKINIFSNSEIIGNLLVSGNILSSNNVRLDGKLTIGDSVFDTLTINTDLTQSIVPGTDSTYDLGKSNKKWADIYLTSLSSPDNIITSSVSISDQIFLSGSPTNILTTSQSNESLLLQPATGITIIERLMIDGGTITDLNETILELNSSGARGHVHFIDNSAIRIPFGNTDDRGYTEIGETRWNSDLGYLECYDGVGYQTAQGGGTIVTPDMMDEFSLLYNLILG